LQKIKEKKFSQKYHMIKFFERKKLTRKFLQLEKTLDQETAAEAPNRKKITLLENERQELENKLTVSATFLSHPLSSLSVSSSLSMSLPLSLSESLLLLIFSSSVCSLFSQSNEIQQSVCRRRSDHHDPSHKATEQIA
jgi:hypothetical protein